jgi:hypothetical protein
MPSYLLRCLLKNSRAYLEVYITWHTGGERGKDKLMKNGCEGRVQRYNSRTAFLHKGSSIPNLEGWPIQ